MVEPGPHDKSAGKGEDGRVGKAGYEGFDESTTGGGGGGAMATGLVVGPELPKNHVKGASDGEKSQVQGSASVVYCPYGLPRRYFLSSIGNGI